MRSAASALRLLQTVVAMVTAYISIYSHMARDFIALTYQISNIGRTLPGNNFVDHSDVIGASPVGAAPTTSFPTQRLTSFDWAKPTSTGGRESFRFWDLGRLILESLR